MLFATFLPDWLQGVLVTLIIVYMVGDVVKTFAYVRARKRVKQEILKEQNHAIS